MVRYVLAVVAQSRVPRIDDVKAAFRQADALDGA
jgi:hypothetical protein